MTKKKKKNRLKQLKNSFLVKRLPIIIGTLLLTGILIFLIAYNSYQEAFKVDIDGYMIGDDSIDVIKSEEVTKEEVKIGTVKLKSNESVYKNTFDHYVDSQKKNTINVEYPLYVNDGLTIVNYNENINLLDTEFDRTTGYKNLVISYGKLYDNSNYTQIDKESYLFVSYQNGVFINLYDVRVETITNTYEIPTNSFLFFMEDQLNYFERTKKGFVKKSITDVDLDSLVTFYYTGGNEEYEYTYGELLKKTGSVYIVEEIPPIEITPDEPEIEDVPVTPEDPIPPEESEPTVPEDTEWQKPTVISSELTGNVYSISGKIEIIDPANTITKAPTYTLYVNNRITSRRTFYTTGDITISGLKSETEYVIVGQYTYLDKDGKTKKIVTFYTGIVTTKDRSLLKPVEIDFELGDLYAKKIELNNLKITSSLDSESLKGVNKVALIAKGEKYMINTRNIQKILSGEEVTIATGENLPSNSVIPFEIKFYDKEGYEIPMSKNIGETRTCKQAPKALLKIKESDNVTINLNIDLKNQDDVVLNNYRYVVTNQIGKVVSTGLVTGQNVLIKNLESNQIFHLELLADYDLNDEKGIVTNQMLGEIDFTTLPIESLGFLYLTVNFNDITSNSVVTEIKANTNKTDPLLLQLIDEIEISIYDNQTLAFVEKKVLKEDEIKQLSAGDNYQSVNFDNLSSDQEYKVKFKAIINVGVQRYEIECVASKDTFETNKIAAAVNIKNQFVTSYMIDFDIQIYDIDETILSGDVRIELRDKNNKLVKSQVIKTSTTDYIRMTYDNLNEKEDYTLKIIANQYNETNDSSQTKTKHVLYISEPPIYTEEGITGKIELISSVRKPKADEDGNIYNILDINSNINWYETEAYYTVPKTISKDEDGNSLLHLYSKSSSSSYSYDLSEYEGRYVTVKFDIKAITPTKSGSVCVSQWISGSCSSSYGGKTISGIKKDSWITVTHSFLVGAKVSGNDFIKYGDVTYGKNKGNFLNFYISGGTSVLSEYVIRKLHVELSDKEPIEIEHNSEIIQGTYDKNKVEGNSTTVARLSELVSLEGGYHYEFKSNVDQIQVHLFYENGKYWKSYGFVIPGSTYYIPQNTKAMVLFRNTENAKEIDPETIEFTVKKIEKITKTITEVKEYEYEIDTKVKVNVSDLRNEITNNDYFIKVYENEELKEEYNYVELVDKNSVENAIKNINVEENKNYRVELGIQVRERYYVLHDFDLSTEGEVRGISTVNDWAFIQPRGNYILINDIYFEREAPKKVGWGNRYFYGTIDFQGYTIRLHDTPTGEGLKLFDRIEKTAVLKNLVLDIHYDQKEMKTYYQSFVYNNYGTFENININIYNETPSNLTNRLINPLVYINQRTGVIRNFVIQVVNPMNFYYNSSLLVRTNHGLVENGYVYGEDIIVDPIYPSSTWSYLSLIQVHGGSRSILQNIYVLPSLKFPDKATAISGVLTFETYGKVRNSYIMGDGNTSVVANGPTIGVFQSIAETKNVYYMARQTYSAKHSQRINSTAINDLYFQQSTLGEGFNIDELMELGYYPHINYTSTTMPSQPYIDLPEIEKDNDVDIISMETTKKSNNSAEVVFNVNNKNGNTIESIEIEELNVKVIGQTYKDGKSYVTASITDPVTFKSKYVIKKIKSVDYLGNVSIRNYSLGEKYAEIDFYREISKEEEFKQLAQKNTENFKLMKNLDFRDYNYSDYYISTFSGTLDGDGYQISNITVDTSDGNGLFGVMNGKLKNITFKDYTQTSNSTYYGVVGSSSSNYATYENVHVVGATIILPENRGDTLYAGGLVGYLSKGKIQDCSVTDFEMSVNHSIKNVAIGGIVGYGDSIYISNSYVQDINVSVNKVISVYGVGGIVGRQVNTNSFITNTYSTGKIYNDYQFTGGIAGYSEGGIEQSYSSVNLSSRIGYIAGIVGYITNDNNTTYDKNLYYGNLYSPKNPKKIIGNKDPLETNYSLSTSLVNGRENSLNGTETILTLEELTNPENYKDAILLGESFDYSKLPEKVLPKMYKSDTEEYLGKYYDEEGNKKEIQRDNKIFTPLFDIEEIKIQSHDSNGDSAFVRFKIDIISPLNYNITSIKIDDLILKEDADTNNSIVQTESNGKTKNTITATFTPDKFYDSYKMSEITYTYDGETYTEEIECLVEAQFYKIIRNIDDWQNISTEYAENYYIDLGIDEDGERILELNFENKNINMGALLNRLEPYNESEVITIKNVTINNTKNRNGISLIKRLYTNIEGIKFENITITDTSTKNNSYINIIERNFGDMKNMEFKNINIIAANENYVAPIGANYGNYVENIKLSSINVKGSSYVGGFMAAAKNAEGRMYQNIEALVEDDYKDESGNVLDEHKNKNIVVTAGGSYVGGIFGYMDVFHEQTELLVNNIKVEHATVDAPNGTYVGGIGGISDCNNCEITDSKIIGKIYVGGIMGYQRSAYSKYLTARNLTVNAYGYYVGGITGYSRYLYTAFIEKSTVELIGASTYGAGGISGYASGYSIRNLGVSEVNVISPNTEAGGLIGRFNGGNVYASYVQNSNITSLNKAGGMYGSQIASWGWTNQVIVTNTNVKAVNSMAGGITGDFGNASNAHAYMKEIQITNTNIEGKTLVGGFMGSLRYKPYLPQSIYSLYFEGNVKATEGNAGIATGDDYNAYFLSFNRVVVYENSTVTLGASEKFNANSKKEYNEWNENLISGATLKHGFYLKNGEETSHIDYPNAAYTEELITLEKEKTYRIGLDQKGGTNWFDIVLYNTNDEYISHVSTDSDNVRKYIDRHFNMSGATEISFNTLRDCKIRIMFYNINEVDSFYMYRGDYGTYGMDPLQVVNNKQLRNPVTWTRYLNSTKKPDFYHSTLLNFNYSYFDWTKLSGDTGTIEIGDKSTDDIKYGNLTASAISQYGATFDGIDDNFVVNNYNINNIQNLTISTNVTLPYLDNNRTNQFIFSSEDFTKGANGIGLYIDKNRKLYIRVMGVNYNTSYSLPINLAVDITVTVNGDKILTYINGKKLDFEITKEIKHESSAKITISNEFGGKRFNGIIKYLTLYERTLESSEIATNYKNQNLSNPADLKLNFDFTELEYSSSDGYYPTVLDGGLTQTEEVKYPPSQQIPTPLPTSSNREYPNLTSSRNPLSSNVNLLNKRIYEIYKVYPSGINTVNIEFTDTYDDVSFKYSNGKYSSDFIKTEQRVYTLTYDYNNDLDLTIKSSIECIDITIKKEELARTIGIINDSYYYIRNGELYENGKKLNIKARHISGDLVLINDQEVYNVTNQKKSKPIFNTAVLTKQIPLYEYMISNTYIKTYYNFTQITNELGETVIRDGQIMIKDGRMFVFNNNEDVNQTMQIFTNYNTSDYQISLSQNKLISIKEEIKFPTYFLNSNIIEVGQDNSNSEPVIIIKYKDGYVCVFDYYSGEIKFSSGTKPEVSLTKYMIESISNKYVLSSSNSSYKETIKLKDKILNVSDKEVKDKLVVGTISGSDSNNDTSDIDLPAGTLSGGNGQALTDQYIQVYNYKTGKYEIYSTKDLLNAEEKVITSTENKIYKDEFLYNYFYGNKVNRFIEKNRVLIIFTIIALIIINLIIFSKYVTKKEAIKA